MDHFENLVGTLMEAEGKWVRHSHCVDLTKQEKAATGKHSIPRPEIDMLVFLFKANKIIALEVKSFLDSPGIKLADLQAEHEVATGRYKLFTAAKYRTIVLARLKEDLIELGMANASTTIQLGLACGKVHQGRSDEVRAYLEGRGIFFWSPEDIRTRVVNLAESKYKNDTATMVAKLLLR